MEEKKGMIQRKVAQIRGSLTFKLASIAFVVLVLLIPIFTIQSLIYERKNRQAEVLREVGATWGGDQYLVGPVLTIPYSTWREKDDGTKTEEKHFAHFLPDELNISGNLAHEIRRKSIYDVILFQGDLLLSGKFEHPDFSSFFVPEQDVHWEAAGLSFGISGMNGIKDISALSWDGDTLRPGPGTAYPRLIPSGVSVQLPLTPGGT
ncbi:MAG: cell envelope integrity protein CreD, partial [Bacteroidetes bacterium]